MNRFFIAALAFAAGCFAAEIIREPVVGRCETKVFTRVDTVRVTVPEVMLIERVRSVTERMPLAEAPADSVDVDVPVERVVYAGDGYRAYLSGFRPRLDSLSFVSSRTAVGLQAQRRISVGIQAGVGITPRGVQPFIGIGVSYRLL